MQVSQAIATWYEQNKRLLPWRENPDPYRVWLSEIILQQTRVNQGVPYYIRFTERYPKLSDLAKATIEEVLLVWEGLGYYSRARNLHKAAKIIQEKYKGQFPNDYKNILALPGVGQYTAAAIASLAFNLPHAAVDGNVYRVLARLLGIAEATDSSAGKRVFQQAADEMLDPSEPGKHNQAMIELGALVCIPRNPKCEQCPVKVFCYAYKQEKIDSLPVKKKVVKVRKRYFTYLSIRRGSTIFIRQRNESDIWRMLYELPLIETNSAASLETILKGEAWQQFFGGAAIHVGRVSTICQHKLSHQHIYAKFVEVEVLEHFEMGGYLSISLQEIQNFAFPKLLVNYFKDRGEEE